jgi:hypothetical protein
MTWGEIWGENVPERAVQLGGEHYYTRVVDKNEKWIGINEYHKHPVTGKTCGGWAPFDVQSEYLTPGSEKWTVESYEPLTLSPSLLCTMPDCGNHGYIRQGKWVSC